jgi:lactoylglutathione lyase
MLREPFPILYADDVDAMVRFYCENFDFDVSYRWPDEGPLAFAFLALEPLGIGISGRKEPLHGLPLEPPGPPGFELCVYVDDTDEAARRLLAAGVKQLRAPTTQPWGERLAYFEDPERNPIHVTARLA